MKKLLLLLTIVASVSLSAMAQKSSEIKFVAETHNFGKIAKGKPVTVVFRFTNTSENPLIISSAQADCGCTTPVVTPKLGTAMAKGASGTIKVTYDAAAEGVFTKNVTLQTNTALKSKVLTLKGEVLK